MPPERQPAGKASHSILLVPALSLLVPIFLFIFSPVGCDRLTDGYSIGMQKLRDCPAAAEVLGPSPDKTWGWSNFSVERAGSSGSAYFEMKVAGSKQRATYEFGLTRTVYGWTLDSAHLLLDDDRIVDVLACGAAPAPMPTLSAAMPAPPSSVAIPPPGLEGVQVPEFYCRHGMPSMCKPAALLYLHGAGVPADRARATELLDIGCRAGQADACTERTKL